MFKRRRPLEYVLAGLFAFFIVCLFLRIRGAFTTTIYTDKEIAAQMADEDFDGSLLRLNTMDKLTNYCDSLYAANSTTRTYPGIVSEVIRKRFYHGYAYYNSGNNPLGVFLEPIVGNGATAIVIPNDILESPHAACSQQSIVGMEVFRRKGNPVRKVTMYDSVKNTGHFTYEVYYDNGWHFFDPDQEPDQKILKSYNYPSITQLKKYPEIVAAAYHKRDIASFQRLVANSQIGPINKFPAPNAYFYQVSTKFFTSFGWAFVWLFILVRNRIRRKKMRIVSKQANTNYKEYEPTLSYTFGMQTGSSSS
jgi:hypothetical protein